MVSTTMTVDFKIRPVIGAVVDTESGFFYANPTIYGADPTVSVQGGQ
jgi:hypothetical protein